jgi:ATP-dependent RNA helicase DeaD
MQATGANQEEGMTGKNEQAVATAAGSIHRGGGGHYSRLFVNLGTKDGFFKASFLQFILDMSDLKKEVLGKIDMKEMNSWIEIDKSAAPQMIRALDGKSYKGRRIRMNDADSGGPQVLPKRPRRGEGSFGFRSIDR